MEWKIDIIFIKIYQIWKTRGYLAWGNVYCWCSSQQLY